MDEFEMQEQIEALKDRIEWLETMLFRFHLDHEQRLMTLEPKIELHTMESAYE